METSIERSKDFFSEENFNLSKRMCSKLVVPFGTNHPVEWGKVTFLIEEKVNIGGVPYKMSFIVTDEWQGTFYEKLEQ